MGETIVRKGFEIPIEQIGHPEMGQGGYAGFNPRSEVLKVGWKADHPAAKAITSDILAEHDVAITMRDGAKLYADIYRPPGSDNKKVPALIMWSPFGKKFNGNMSLSLMTPWRLGIPSGALSGLEKFEALDPAAWVPHDYAIVNVDVRGTGDSDDRMAILGTQEAQDGYDTIEEIAKLPWCTGKVGMESVKRTFEKYPLENDYWNDKRPDMKKINVPAYITGTWTNTRHGMGAIRGFLEINNKNKWLRWHPWQEWYDLWGNPQSHTGLMSFFDHFLHGKTDNGWQETPKVRMAVLRFGNQEPQAYENIVEEDFPIPRTDYRKLYFTASGSLSSESPEDESKVSYDSETPDRLLFSHKFDTTTRLVGMPKAVVYMSCADLDDMDVYVMLEKLDKAGNAMINMNVPWKNLPIKSFDEMKREEQTEVVLYKGPLGILRASHRAIDESKSMHPHWPFHPHEKEEKITPGTVVRLDIGIWAMGIEYEAGESLRVSVGGQNAGVSNFGTNKHSLNKGRHNVHVGGRYPSHVILLFV